MDRQTLWYYTSLACKEREKDKNKKTSTGKMLEKKDKIYARKFDVVREDINQHSRNRKSS